MKEADIKQGLSLCQYTQNPLSPKSPNPLPPPLANPPNACNTSSPPSALLKKKNQTKNT